MSLMSQPTTGENHGKILIAVFRAVAHSAAKYHQRISVEAFRDAVSRAPNPGLSEALATLADLNALSWLERDRAWYLESGYFEPAKSRAIRGLVGRLCDEVAEHALDLVDGFGIPFSILAAPDGAPRG